MYSSGARIGDRWLRVLVMGLASSVLAVFAGIVLLLAVDSRESVVRYGLGFLTESVWDPVFEEFGALPYIYGTVVTSLLAVLFATPIAVLAAVYVGLYASAGVRPVVSFTTELLAAIPSIIYGLWGFFVLAPIMRMVEPWLQDTFGPLPIVGRLFEGTPIGRDLLMGGVILTVMILPTVMSVSREVILAVPIAQVEGMLALGATRWETVWKAVLPFARPGIAGAVILGLGRALGETMAVTMVIGNSSSEITGSLFTPGYTLASSIANQFTEADKPIYFSAIVEVGLLLLAVAAVLNVAARLLVWTVSRGAGGAGT